MTNKKALGRQDAPHRSFRVGLLFFMADRVTDSLQVADFHASLLMNGDVRKPYIAYRITLQARNATAYRSCISHLEMLDTDAVNRAHMIYWNQLGYCVVIARAT